MSREVRVPLFDLIASLSDTVDLISPAVANHHAQVAYIALSIATELGLSAEERNHLVQAGALHDIGAFSLREREDLLDFEINRPHLHSKAGHWLLRTFDPFKPAAELVRCHHVPWEHGAGARFEGEQAPLGSHILHLADRVAVLINTQDMILLQVARIRERVAEQSGELFHPDFVDAFKRASAREYFWLDATSRSLLTVLRNRVKMNDVVLDTAGILQLAELFRRLIDFRSHYTATHSSGVAASAEHLARLAGFSEDDCRDMRVASCLHDLGKLGIPREILEKPARLTHEEFAVMEGHVYYTYRILEPIAGLHNIREWSAYHQERLDGSGYPFHLTGKELSLGARILAVADVFTAITEDRPYRPGMAAREVRDVLNRMVENGELDADAVSLLNRHFDEINASRMAAQKAAVEEYKQFQAAVA